MELVRAQRDVIVLVPKENVIRLERGSGSDVYCPYGPRSPDLPEFCQNVSIRKGKPFAPGLADVLDPKVENQSKIGQVRHPTVAGAEGRRVESFYMPSFSASVLAGGSTLSLQEAPNEVLLVGMVSASYIHALILMALFSSPTISHCPRRILWSYPSHPLATEASKFPVTLSSDCVALLNPALTSVPSRKFKFIAFDKACALSGISGSSIQLLFLQNMQRGNGAKCLTACGARLEVGIVIYIIVTAVYFPHLLRIEQRLNRHAIGNALPDDVGSPSFCGVPMLPEMNGSVFGAANLWLFRWNVYGLWVMRKVWVIPANQPGFYEILWDKRVYGLIGVWFIRGSTVKAGVRDYPTTSDEFANIMKFIPAPLWILATRQNRLVLSPTVHLISNDLNLLTIVLRITVATVSGSAVHSNIPINDLRSSVTAGELAHSMRHGQEFQKYHDPSFEFSRKRYRQCTSPDINRVRLHVGVKVGRQRSKKSMIQSIRVRSESSVDYGEIHRVEILLYRLKMPPSRLFTLKLSSRWPSTRLPAAAAAHPSPQDVSTKAHPLVVSPPPWSFPAVSHAPLVLRGTFAFKIVNHSSSTDLGIETSKSSSLPPSSRQSFLCSN
ncbi:hypothetical protein DFH08DRAFT_810555 [Mycena albidolilacea]|uniref:Uncharacterized protein n=1 Tax=Mycena albidolilacea TaxID=1033008 RepID=A0AAD6ZYB9_9AGAR|nr:hypothetical protein DFH08DRAFT_810555 [Mycena albidolilacea]